MSPPPDLTIHLHCAQVPPPPQADDKKMFCAASVCSNLPPASASTVFSSLIRILTLPELTNWARAAKIKNTSDKTITVNITTPITIIVVSMSSTPYKDTPEKDMKPIAIKPDAMKVIPIPRNGPGTSLYFSFSRILANATTASAQPNPEPRP